ncbi:amidohydrolase family protein [Jeotgalibaca dankookensis]|uniref:amidohydrolase family protein n=1 Tax=Jeotgalibaca dankookensis TaxID=708126 RepID=UPI0007850C21|nr:amidohydrolase family protein [Jeotgalibaca dankookensis]
MAQKYDLSIDMHADFGTDASGPQNTVVELIAEKTIERGYEGRVSLGHVTTLGSIDPEVAEPIFEKLAKAQVTIVPLPATDMFMNGQAERKNKPRGMAPVKAMLEKGVNVAYSSNNIRNAFTPFGDANLVTVGYLLQVSQQMGSAKERSQVVEMATTSPAKTLELTDTYGIEVGKHADLNIFDSHTIRDFINDQSKLRYVIKKGEILVKNEYYTELNALLEDE